MNRSLFVVFLVSTCTVASAWTETISSLLAKYEPTATFTTSEPMIPFVGYNLYYAVDKTNAHITFAVEASTTGWIGLGLAEAAGMKGADIMMGHVDSTGKAVVGDYHSTSNAKPVRDGCQDWNVHYGEESVGKTLLVFSRKFATGDSNDHEIFSELTGGKRLTFLCAYGANDDYASYGYHGSKRIKYSIDLDSAVKVSRATWTAAKVAKTSMSYIDLRAAGTASSGDFAAVSKGGKLPDNGGKDYPPPTPGGFVVPTDKTTYIDFCYPLSNNLGWNPRDSYMVAFEGLPDPSGRTSSPNNIHHQVLSAFDGDDCGGNEQVIWVGGVTFFEDLPTGVGIAFSRFSSFKVQTHYDNPAGTSGLLDDSGVRIYLDTTAPVHEAGTMQLGDGTIELSRTDGSGAGTDRAVIPPGRSFWTFGCPASFTNAWPIPKITVFGSLLHMHKMGDMMYTEVIHADGTPTKRVNSVQYFDFDHQDPTLVTPFEIKKGDSLKTRCYFKNTRDANTPLHFGLSSDEEMCIDFLYYYPYNAGIKGHCTMDTASTGYNAYFGGTYDGTQTITDASDAGMRVFGTEVGTEDAATCNGGAVTEIEQISSGTTPSSAEGPVVDPVEESTPSSSKTPISATGGIGIENAGHVRDEISLVLFIGVAMIVNSFI